MFPRQFYVTEIISQRRRLEEPRCTIRARERVKDKLLSIITNEAIDLAERESTNKLNDRLAPGDLELTATLYVMNRQEMKEFIHYIQTNPYNDIII